MKTKSIILLIVSLAFGLVAAAGITQVVMGGNDSKEPKIKMGEVVVATKQLGHDEILTEENVKIEKWPISIIPENAARSMEEIKDLKIATRLSRGLPILKSDLNNKYDSSALPIPDGFRVCAIKVAADDTFNGLLQPGDKVDVIGVFKVKQKSTGNQISTTHTFLKAVTVYSVGSSTRRQAGPREANGSGSSIVGVLLNAKQAEQLVLVQKEASLKLVLRGKDEIGDDTIDSLDDLPFWAKNKDAAEGENEFTQQPTDGHVMRVWDGGKKRDHKFDQDGRVIDNNTPVEETPADENGDSKNADYDDLDRSSDSDRNLDEDQYPGR